MRAAIERVLQMGANQSELLLSADMARKAERHDRRRLAQIAHANSEARRLAACRERMA